MVNGGLAERGGGGIVMTDSQTLSTDRQTHRKAIQLGDILLSTHFQRTDFVQKTQNDAISN